MGNYKKEPRKVRQDESAPYRFVPLNAVVAPSPVSGAALNCGLPQLGHLDATINIDWLAETPFLIGEEDPNGTVAPFRLGANYAIPGASIKGMLRSVMEIICYGRLTQTNAHHRYGYRDFMHPDYKARLTNSNNVKAGWLVKEEGELYIEEADWYKLDISSICKAYSVSYDRWPTLPLMEKYQRCGKRTGSCVAFEPTERFSIETVKNRIASLDSSNSSESKRGVLVCSGGIPQPRNANPNRKFQKRYEYIFVEKSNAQRVPLEPEIFNTFVLNHSKPGKNRRDPEGSWRDLQPTWKSKNRLPIFYCGDLGRQSSGEFYFGLTRLFKIPYQNSIGDILKRNHPAYTQWPKEDTPDMVEALFGFVYEEDEKPENSDRQAQKGRIAFGFAEPRNKPKVSPSMDTVMMGPRASFAPYYLAGKQLDYNNEDVHLAGRKRYLVRYPQQNLSHAEAEIRRNLKQSVSTAHNKEIITRLQYLLPSKEPQHELRFSGEIRLKNVHPVELGAVLWAISFGNTNPTRIQRHTLGRGKAFGMGQLHAAKIELQVDCYDGAKRSENQEERQRRYLAAFEAYMKDRYPDWPKYLQNDYFDRMSNPEVGAKMRARNKLGYPGNHQAHRNIKVDRQQDEKTPFANASDFPRRLLALDKRDD